MQAEKPWVEVNQSDNRYIEGNREAWHALEDALKAGKVRAIGVFNFLRGDLDSLLETAEVKPLVDQVLCHISNTPLSLMEYCRDKDILVEAYAPVAHGEALKNPAIGAMAEKYKVTIRGVQLRKHSKAREKRYSFGYAVSFIFVCYQMLWTSPKSRYLCSRYLPLAYG